MIEVFNETNEIHLSGIVGDGWAEDPITKDGVLKALKAFGSQAVTIRINSPGGAADEGIAIYNLLKDYGGEVTTVNDSLAASAASVIFLGGSNRLMGDGSRIMIHRAMGMAFGNATEIKKTLAALESYDASLVEIYSRFMVDTDPEEIESMMGNETWIGTDESIELGLATAKYYKDNADRKKKKTTSQFDQAKANLLRAKMAKFSKHLTGPGQ
jgi:ATP-dependent protease ClpP protease subunit